jgi:Na+-transporting NADH:ubiquinone oxidoreductase subunit NqrA
MFENITPYAAAKVTNIVLANAELDKVIKPQMLYTYAKKNIIATTTNEKGNVVFIGDAFKEWLDKYVEKVRNGEGATRTDYTALAEQFITNDESVEVPEELETV